MLNKSRLENLTFLVCLKNRTHVTERLINYLNNIDYEINLFFADGGDINQKELIQKLSSNHKFTYKKFSYDFDFLCYANKIYQSLKLINTKYIALMDSDDFFNFNSASKHLKFLENNPTFVTSTGKIINFNLIDNKKVQLIDQQYIQEKEVNFKKNYKFVDFSSWQGVNLTKRLLVNFEKIVHFKINNIRFICDTVNTSAQVDGKLNYIDDEVFILRQANTSFYDNERNVSASTLMRNNKIIVCHSLRSLCSLSLCSLSLRLSAFKIPKITSVRSFKCLLNFFHFQKSNPGKMSY